MNRFLWKLDRVGLGGARGTRLREVSVEVRAGVTAVVGPSGAGKTSLLNLLVEFERPTQGRIDRDLRSTDRLPLFWVPATYGLWPHLCVNQHLTLVAPEETDADEVAALLAQFDLTEKASAYPDSLSEGERARLSVARALAANPDVLLMDEPLVNVDATRAHRYWQAIRERRINRGMSIVIATHSVETVLREADRVLCVSEGRLVYEGDVRSLYQHPSSRQLAEFLGPTNWFHESEDAQRWLEGARPNVSSYRPEHVQVRIAAESRLRVLSSHYGGSLGELEVCDDASSTRRVVLHRPNGRLFNAGDRIIITATLPTSRSNGDDH